MLAMFNIQINNFNFNALGDKSIFLSAQENNILLEYSCLDGRCGSCKAKLISGMISKPYKPSILWHFYRFRWNL